ncbi:MAG: hypothetical protein EG826_04385 [Deltaproteobacteria bacterium]|nr:hypothetical protein [Deltaproteobacteria bacterium]
MPGKTNYCTPDGMCGVPDNAKNDVCKYCKPSLYFDLCIYRVCFADRCMSPFAIAQARGIIMPDIGQRPDQPQPGESLGGFMEVGK